MLAWFGLLSGGLLSGIQIHQPVCMCVCVCVCVKVHQVHLDRLVERDDEVEEAAAE